MDGMDQFYLPPSTCLRLTSALPPPKEKYRFGNTLFQIPLPDPLPDLLPAPLPDILPDPSLTPSHPRPHPLTDHLPLPHNDFGVCLRYPIPTPSPLGTIRLLLSGTHLSHTGHRTRPGAMRGEIEFELCPCVDTD